MDNIALNSEDLSFNISKIPISDIINLEPIKKFSILLLKIVIILLVIWIIFKIISYIKVGRINRRIFKTYDNTEEIKKRLDSLEKKIDKLIEKKKRKK